MKHPKVTEYLAGAMIANAPHIILFFSFLNLDKSSDLIYNIAYFSIPLGAIIAGYLVSGKVESNYILVGGITGLFSFLFHFVLFIVIFSPARSLQNMYHNLSLLVIFVFASNLGGSLRKNLKK